MLEVRIDSVREHWVTTFDEASMERGDPHRNRLSHDEEFLDTSTDAELLAAARRTRVGQLLFVMYTAFYSGFVLISAFQPAWMAKRPWANLNLAIWYGFGLIGLALALAVVYGWICRDREAS